MRKLFSALSSTLQEVLKGGLLLLAVFANMSAIYASNTQVDGIWYDFNNNGIELVDFSTTQGYRDRQEITSYHGPNFSVTFDKGTNNNVPQYNSSKIRVYDGGYFIVSSDSTITKIVVELTSYDGSTEISTDVGTFSNGTWSGNSNSIKFTIGSSAEYIYIRKITITIPGNANTASVAGGNNRYSGSVTIPEKVTYNGTTYRVTSIGEHAFYGCSDLTSVTIPNSITNIAYYAFGRCSSLPSITIPNSVTSIGNKAFYSCDSLTSVTCEATTPPTVGSDAFYNVSKSISVYVPCGCVEAYKTASGWESVNIQEPLAEYSISLTINDSNMGTAQVDKNTTCGSQVSATANYGYHFVRWSDGNTDNPRSLELIQDTVLTAEFAPNSYSVSTQSNDTERGTTSGDTTVAYLDSITISAAAYYGYHFSHWEKDSARYIKKNAASNTITIKAKVPSHWTNKITVWVWSDNNTGTEYIPAYENGWYVYTYTGSVCNIIFKNGYGWNGDYNQTVDILNITEDMCLKLHQQGSSKATYTIIHGNATQQIQVTENAIYTAYFDKNTYYITKNYDSQGNVNGSSSGEYLDTITLTAEPNCGYHFVRWSDGNIENPRYFILTQDTAFSAEFAQSFSGQCGDSLYWKLIDTTLHITGSGEMYNYKSNTVPWKLLVSSIKALSIGESVTSFGDFAFCGCSSLTSVIIPNSVTRISPSSFKDCSNLTSVTINSDAIVNKAYSSSSNISRIFGSQVTEYIIGDDVTGIGKYAFSGCSSLTSLTIPNSVTSIGNSAFWGCDSLTSVTINSDAIVNKFDSYSSMSDIFGSQVIEYIIGDDVKGIGDYAFQFCHSLTSVTIGESVTSIGNGAFEFCSSLTSITIPNSVTSIGNQAFQYCEALTSVTIGESVTNIGHMAFYACFSLTSVTIPNSVTNIGDCAFQGCSSLTSVTIPNSITSIGEGTFRECSSLTSVTIPNSITSIGEGTFRECSSLTSVTIGESVTSIGHSAFYACFSLTSVTIPNSVTSIGEGTFRECSSLTSVTIPNSVTSIGDHAFYSCDSLTSVTCEATTPPAIGSSAFDWEIPVFVPCGCVEAYKAASDWESVNVQEPLAEYSISLTINDSNMGTAQVDKNTACGNQISAIANYGYHFVRWSDGNTDNPRSLELTQDTVLTAEFDQTYSGQCGDNLYWEFANNTLTITGTGAMYDERPWSLLVDQIQKIALPIGITHIGNDAFQDCIGLRDIDLPYTLETIGDYSFDGCRKLITINCYPLLPPKAESTSFSNYSANLYAPCDNLDEYKYDMVFGQFKYFECIGSEPVSTNGTVVTPGSTDVTITWPTEENADTYTIVIMKGDVIFCRLIFNKDGQLLNIAFAPGRNGQNRALYAAQTANGLRFTVTGLEEKTKYGYDVSAQDEGDNTLSSYTGEFTTMGGTAVEDILQNTTNIQKLLRNGQLLIIRDGVEYNAMGQEL